MLLNTKLRAAMFILQTKLNPECHQITQCCPEFYLIRPSTDLYLFNKSLHFKYVNVKFFLIKQRSTITTIISYNSVLVYDNGCSIIQIRWKMSIVWTNVTQMALLKLALISSSSKCNIIKPNVLGPLDRVDL